MTDVVTLYNPANAAALTPEQIDGLQKLSSAEIKELAKAYPNSSSQRAYLLIIDGSKPVEKQLPSLSTFENLYNLRERNGKKNYVAYQFKGTFKPVPVSQQRMSKGPRRTEVMDLSDQELMTLPGFKAGEETMPEEVVKVKKVRKKKTSE